jgi:urease accessory protein
MIKVLEHAPASAKATHTLTLSYDARTKARFMAVSDQGLKLGVQLARGRTLRGGDKLLATDGTVIEVLASAETVSRVELSDSLLLARICYHLGNRHVPLEIGAGFCQFQHDHVLDDMVVGLGGHVQVVAAAFEPESGAYHSHAKGENAHEHGSAQVHSHSHGHSQDQSYNHSHDLSDDKSHNHSHHEH